jgi:hypothetical protein
MLVDGTPRSNEAVRELDALAMLEADTTLEAARPLLELVATYFAATRPG